MIQGKTAVVTGASRGIGFAIAKALAEHGLTVLITGRSRDAIEKTSKMIGKNAIPMVWDASDIAIAESKIEECATLLGGLDIFVNNAGIFALRSEWDRDSLLLITPEGDPLTHERIPYGRFATSEEIADLAMYMLDEKAKMLCGETIIFDGGYAIR